MSALDFRPAREGDLDRVVEIHASAFPDPRGHDDRRRNFTTNTLGALSDLWVAVDDGSIVGHAFLFPLDAWLAGVRVPIGAVASVGVAPEARGRGVAGALLDRLHRAAAERGAVATVLFAFRQGFYARHGYAPTTPTRRLAIHPASIPSGWRAEPGIAVRPAREERAAIEAAYARAAARTNGWLARPPALWDRRFASERRTWMLATAGPHVLGYVAWSLDQREDHAPIRLVVRELAADHDAARRALLGAIGAMRDQVAEVELDVDARDPLDRALIDPDRGRFGDAEVEHALGRVVGGPMIRLVDTKRALDARGIDAPFHVLGGGRIAIDGVTIDTGILPAIVFGGLDVTDAARLGRARADDDAALARAQARFAHAPYFAIDPF